MTTKIAFNPQDRFVVTMGSRIVVITRDGDVFGHEVGGRRSSAAFKFSGSKAAWNPQDRFVVTMGNKLIVTTQSGDVFGHEVSGTDIGPAFKFTGSRMGFNPQDRFAVTVGDTMIVTTQDGNAFGADISARDIGPIFQLNPQDTATFDSGPVNSDLPLGGSVHVVLRQTGDFTFSTSHNDGRSRYGHSSEF